MTLLAYPISIQEGRLRGAYVLRKKGDGERIPSYTDRVLFHSLPDVRHQLHLLAYQMCDGLRGSDHRPVAAAFHLTVNREVDDSWCTYGLWSGGGGRVTG